jgi:hypothetical protein
MKREDAGGRFAIIDVALGIELEWWRCFPGVGVCGSSFAGEPKRKMGRRGLIAEGPVIIVHGALGSELERSRGDRWVRRGGPIDAG